MTTGPGSADAGSGPEDLTSEARQTARLVREMSDGRTPRLGLVLGSGLGALADRLESSTEIPYADLPGFPRPGVEGHAGTLALGSFGGVPVAALRGRAHLYEGHEPSRATFPIRVLAELGIRGLFLSNAAGAIRPAFSPGELMLIRDHLNLMGRNPLIGDVVSGDPRFPDLTDAWDPELCEAAREAARATGVVLREGVYAAVLGPSFETPAEIRMMAALGADAVGMSTVPELIVARARGIRCFGISCLTNYAAGIAARPLDHREVLETTERVAAEFQALVAAAVVAADRVLRDGPSG